MLNAREPGRKAHKPGPPSPNRSGSARPVPLSPATSPLAGTGVPRSTTPRAPNTRFCPTRLKTISDHVATPNGGSGALIAWTFVTESYTAMVPLNRGRGLDGEAVVAAGGNGVFTRCPCPYHGGVPLAGAVGAARSRRPRRSPVWAAASRCHRVHRCRHDFVSAPRWAGTESRGCSRAGSAGGGAGGQLRARMKS
jgi:hypothetical protein